MFIDGGHFFPVPCIDWQYTEKFLRIGGWMVVYDVRIPTVRMLYDFLCAEKVWELRELIGDTAFFVKVEDSTNLTDWGQQPYNRGFPDWSFLPLGERLKHAPAWEKFIMLRRRAARMLGVKRGG